MATVGVCYYLAVTSDCVLVDCVFAASTQRRLVVVAALSVSLRRSRRELWRWRCWFVTVVDTCWHLTHQLCHSQMIIKCFQQSSVFSVVCFLPQQLSSVNINEWQCPL